MTDDVDKKNGEKKLKNWGLIAHFESLNPNLIVHL